MIYKLGTEIEYEGQKLDTLIVDASEVASKVKEGWFKCPSEIGKKKSKEVKTNELD